MVKNDRDPALLIDLMRFKPDMMSANAWAVSAGVSRTVWTDIRRHANPSRRTLEKLLAAAGSSLAEFEALRIGVPPPLLHEDPNFALGDARADRPGIGTHHVGLEPHQVDQQGRIAVVLHHRLFAPRGPNINIRNGSNSD